MSITDIANLLQQTVNCIGDMMSFMSGLLIAVIVSISFKA